MPIKMTYDQEKINKLSVLMSDIPKQGIPIVIEAITGWIIGEQSEAGNYWHGLSHYPEYKYVTRAAAYGNTFVSDKQRRYVMARIREGSITPGKANRTFAMQRGWRATGTPYKNKVSNIMPYTKWVMGDNEQARQPAMVGWRKVGDIVATNLKGAMRHAISKLNEWVKSKL